MLSHARIAIVGAGIIGCLTAREIASRTGDASIVVLEREMSGGGASRLSAGLHIPRGATSRVRRMAAYSQAYYEQLKETHPWLPIRPLRMSVVASALNEPLLQAVYLERAHLTRTAILPDRVVRVPEHAAVWTGEGCHHADVYGLVQALANELRRRVSFREGVRVTAIRAAPAAVVLELSCGETLTVEHVVLAPGPWLGATAGSTLVERLGLRVKKIVALHIDDSPSLQDGAIVFEDEDAFLLPLVARRQWLFSYTCQEWDVDPDTVAAGLTPRNMEEALNCLRRHAPELAERCAGGRVFCDAYSPQREPQVRALDSAGRIIFAGAGGGSGYRLAPAIAAEAAGLLHLPSRRTSAATLPLR